MTVRLRRRMWAVGTFIAMGSLTALDAHASEAERVLAELASVLASIEPGGGIAEYQHGRDLTPALRGTPQSRIRAVLGEPNRCDAVALAAPCIDVSDWFYSFYRLEPGARGGGLELLIQFDDAGRVRRTEWKHTR